MANFAVMQDDIVENVILAESLEVAELVTGKTCIEYSDSNPSGIGWKWDGSRFIKPSPYPSWVLGEDYEWHAPIPMPVDDNSYDWNEDTKSWVIV